ncbi:alpha/beta-tubulin-N-acetyltransferase 9 isoform X2 [Dasypus novemcinctus]|uniref:alpha/beta-tubulin-N-acetyltransferase 9 isoform X2 n=1 Tax=Dasypus novemcinctus TaxID=9361 RepID=UPI000C8470FF|nr:alpha/beta-tubulin-N-acetyltransferase 9 isoform X2 [Dasypus novemcinctus]
MLVGALGAATMRLNQNTLLLGKKVVLVPYTSAHVPRYHEWMKSEELQRLTASEPLTLEQEYTMQHSWREDADKCTFIVLDAEKWQAQPGTPEESCMAGDVNLFLTDPGDPTLGEIEVMIAEPSCRGRGFGTEAVLMMMLYGGCEQRLPGGDAQTDGERAGAAVASGADQPRGREALQRRAGRGPTTALASRGAPHVNGGRGTTLSQGQKRNEGQLQGQCSWSCPRLEGTLGLWAGLAGSLWWLMGLS